MSFGSPDFGLIPGVTCVISGTPLTSASQLPVVASLTDGTAFAAGASFTYNSQDIIEGHIYIWDANTSLFVDQSGAGQPDATNSIIGFASSDFTITMESAPTVSELLIIGGTPTGNNQAGGGVQLVGGNGGPTSGVGANASLTGGNAIAGNSNGGNVVLTGGSANGTGTPGQIEVNGNLSLMNAGNKLNIATGSNASIGTSAAMTAGAITISTTAVTASSKIILSRNTAGGTTGNISAPTGSITAGTSFGIVSSSNTDTSTVNWFIIN